MCDVHRPFNFMMTSSFVLIKGNIEVSIRSPILLRSPISVDQLVRNHDPFSECLHIWRFCVYTANKLLRIMSVIIRFSSRKCDESYSYSMFQKDRYNKCWYIVTLVSSRIPRPQSNTAIVTGWCKAEGVQRSLGRWATSPSSVGEVVWWCMSTFYLRPFKCNLCITNKPFDLIAFDDFCHVKPLNKWSTSINKTVLN